MKFPETAYYERLKKSYDSAGSKTWLLNDFW